MPVNSRCHVYGRANIFLVAGDVVDCVYACFGHAIFSMFRLFLSVQHLNQSGANHMDVRHFVPDQVEKVIVMPEVTPFPLAVVTPEAFRPAGHLGNRADDATSAQSRAFDYREKAQAGSEVSAKGREDAGPGPGRADRGAVGRPSSRCERPDSSVAASAAGFGFLSERPVVWW